MSGHSRDSILDEAPQRPALGALFGVGISAWLAAGAAEWLSWQFFIDAFDTAFVTHVLAAFATVLVLLCALCTAIARVMHRLRCIKRIAYSFVHSGVMLCCLSFGIVICTSLMYWSSWEAQVQSVRELFASGQEVHVELSGDPVVRDYGTVSNARLSAGQGGGPMSASVRVLWPEGEEALSAGHALELRGSVSAIKADEGGRWNHQNGFVGMIKVTRVEETGYSFGLQGLVCRFRDASFARIEQIGGEPAALLAGVLLGERSLYAGTELEQSFKTTGLAHLMAVSGTHLAVVSMLVVSFLSTLRFRQVQRNVVTLCILVLYVALTCFSFSALRACAMCAIALIAASAKRRKHIISALSLSIFLFVGFSPSVAFSLGFLLSVLSVGGLVVFGPLFQSWIGYMLPNRMEKTASAVSATCAATFLTLPVTVPLFAQLPLISPISNLIAAPLITGALVVGIPGLLVYEIVPPVGMLLLRGSGAIAACCARVVHVLADVPFACMPIDQQSQALAAAFVLAMLALWVLWPLPHARGSHVRESKPPSLHTRARLVAPTLVLCLFCAPALSALATGFGNNAFRADPNASRIVMIDVGQGDCMLIESGDAHMLVDTGENGDVLQRGLARQGVTHLDAVLITHKDIDHCGALRNLAGVVSVDHVFIHADLLDESFEAQVLEAARWVTGGRGAEGLVPGSRIEAGDFALTMLAPQNGGKSENEDSLVNLVEYDAEHDGVIEARGLLTGDAEADATKRVVESLEHIDVLKVPHHGSKGGMTQEELERLRPTVALIGVGADNKYGHPAKETLGQLEQSGARVYRTDTQGDITVEFSKDAMRVFTQR